jgi:uncharacterized protein (UPF0261 family)
VAASAPTVVLIGTLDTKGPEISYLRDRIREAGCQTLVLDSGILGGPIGIVPDLSREEVARASGHDLEHLRKEGKEKGRGAAVELMMKGIQAAILRLYKEGRCQGVASLGGAEGAVMAAHAVQVLPVGVPKVIVSPLASGRRIFHPFIGIRDVMVMHSVIDILGINSVSREIFDQAAGAVAGMALALARRESGKASDPKRVVAITMLGNTTRAIQHVIKPRLEEKGYEVLIFHSNGVGGAAMEEMVRERRIGAVIDYTTDELTDHLVGGFHDAGPRRLEAAGELGLPQVVVPGCVDFFVQGPKEAIPEKWRGRKAYYHNPSFTLLRTSREEMLEVARTLARKVNGAKGPVAVAVPARGLSIPNVPEGAFWDPEGDAAFRAELRKGLRPDIECAEADAHINDEKFAEKVLELFLRRVN